MKLNLLTVFSETQILLQTKLKINELIQTKKEEVKHNIIEIVENKSFGYEELVADYILSKVILPFYLKPFKGKIKKVIIKNMDKLFLFLKNKIQEV